MFKRGVQPRWEDPRNKHGGNSHLKASRLGWCSNAHEETSGEFRLIVGAWTFRVHRDKARDFFGHILLLLIGESLSNTLESRNPPPPPGLALSQGVGGDCR